MRHRERHTERHTKRDTQRQAEIGKERQTYRERPR